MQRQIKLRAWCEENKEMYFADSEYGFLVSESSVGYCPHYASDDLTYYSTNPCSEEKKIEVMQFTGLKDKNGKEIYEGDILAIMLRKEYGHQYDSEEPVPVGSVEFGRIAVDNDTLYTFNAFHIKGHSIEYYLQMQLEVIGNIYENPTLTPDEAK